MLLKGHAFHLENVEFVLGKLAITDCQILIAQRTIGYKYMYFATNTAISIKMQMGFENN